jgi:threonine dehydratase
VSGGRLAPEAVLDAAHRIRGRVHRTPVATSRTLDAWAGRRLFFKAEVFQRVGAFKIRGATNAVLRLPADVAARGVVAHSSGNHAQALALAARERGIPATIVMPSNASPVKRAAVEGYGARVVACEPTLRAREETAERIVAESLGTMIPPYDHPDVIAGQGTAALELIEDLADAGETLDALVAPVGGGGLVSGTCLAARLRTPSPRVFAAEPAGADDAARSKAAGRLLPQTDPRTCADGLLTGLGAHTWPFVRDEVEAVLTVGEDEIHAAMRMLWERAKLMAEPSAAVALAAVLTPAFRALPGLGRVGVILSGGNADLDRLPWASGQA